MINNLIKNNRLSKGIFDVSWGRFYGYLSYKAEEAGRKVIRVNPMNTSINCCECGKRVEKTLAVRVHSCPYCGLVMDRDENAARNILRVGQTLQPLTCAVT
jgi:putative transposase